MQSSAFFAILLFQLGLCDFLKKRAGCNADNCLRKITGTANATPNLSSRLADCSSFVQVIVEPAPMYTFSCYLTVIRVLILSAKHGDSHFHDLSRRQERSWRWSTRLPRSPPSNDDNSSLPRCATLCKSVLRNSTIQQCLLLRRGHSFHEHCTSAHCYCDDDNMQQQHMQRHVYGHELRRSQLWCLRQCGRPNIPILSM
jgi:hypothetical protein